MRRAQRQSGDERRHRRALGRGADALTRAAAAGLVLIASGGCVPDGPQPPRRPEPVTISKPTDLSVQRVGFAVDNAPIDRDGNGFFDTWMVTAFLFPPQREHPLAIFAEGDVGFALRQESGDLIARWRFTQEDLAGARLEQLVGETYRTPVSLLDAETRADTETSRGGGLVTGGGSAGGSGAGALRGADRLRPGRAILFMTYFPPTEDARPIESERGVAVRVGPTGV